MNLAATARIPEAAGARCAHTGGNIDPALQESELRLYGPDSPRRADIEALVQREYRRHFDADIREFMPYFLALRDASGEVTAVVGCRSAALESLFLEVYTDAPIESLIRERTSEPVRREEVVEIGSLVCRDARAAMALIRALVPFLVTCGFEWVAFTGADTVVRVLRSLNLLPLALCVADRERLGGAQFSWGSYYEHDPVVMAGRLRDGLSFLQAGARQR
jgi:hypothetical protein